MKRDGKIDLRDGEYQVVKKFTWPEMGDREEGSLTGSAKEVERYEK